MDDAESHGTYVSPERAGNIAEQEESLGTENILEGQTLYSENGQLRIENVGLDKWIAECTKPQLSRHSYIS